MWKTYSRWTISGISATFLLGVVQKNCSTPTKFDCEKPEPHQIWKYTLPITGWFKRGNRINNTMKHQLNGFSPRVLNSTHSNTHGTLFLGRSKQLKNYYTSTLKNSTCIRTILHTQHINWKTTKCQTRNHETRWSNFDYIFNVVLLNDTRLFFYLKNLLKIVFSLTNIILVVYQ